MHFTIGNPAIERGPLPNRLCLPEHLYSLLLGRLLDGTKILLHVGDGAKIPVYSTSELKFACEIVAEHHNTIQALQAERDWIDETQQMFQRSEQFMLESSSSSEYETSDTEYHSE